MTAPPVKLIMAWLLLVISHVTNGLEEHRDGPKVLVPSSNYGCVPLIKNDISVSQFQTICKTLEFDPMGLFKCCTHDGEMACESENTGELFKMGTLDDYNGALMSCETAKTQESGGETLKDDHRFMVKSGLSKIKSVTCKSVAYGIECESNRIFVAYDWYEIDRIVGVSHPSMGEL